MDNQTENPKKLDFKTQFQNEQTALTEAATAFDIDDFTQDADVVHTVFVPNIGADKQGRTIRYVRFNNEDGKLLEPYVKASKYEQGLRTLAIMMFKADGKTTYEKLAKMDSSDTVAILNAIEASRKSFQPQKSS